MSKTVLHVKTDRDVKERAQSIARELGVPLSVVVNAYLKEFIRERAIRIALAPQLRPEIGALLEQAKADYAAGKNIGTRHSDAATALAELHR